MIIGNPYQLSFFIKVIKEWNLKDDISSFRNGVLLFCLDGEYFPKQVVTATLNVDIPFLKYALSNITINEKIFNMKKKEAFIEMYNITFPGCYRDDIDNDFRYYVSPPTLSDNDCVAFAVSNRKQVRIMAAKLNYIKEESTHDLNNMDVREAFITHAELKEIILKMDYVLRQEI